MTNPTLLEPKSPEELNKLLPEIPPGFVSVYLREEAIARLKWLNDNYIRKQSLDDALDKVLSLAADAYRQKDKIGLVIGDPQPKREGNEKESLLVKVLLRKKAISNLKWLKEHCFTRKEDSLHDTLDRAIALATFIYQENEKGIIKMKKLDLDVSPSRAFRLEPEKKGLFARLLAI